MGKINELKQKFSNDYRVLLRYMSYHIHYVNTQKCHSLVQSIYDNIINNCTDDDVRICAKRHIVQHYRNMAYDKSSSITFDDVEKVLSTMPYMRDGKDFISCYLYNEHHPKHHENCMETLEEILGLLDCVLEHCTIWNGDEYCDYNIELIKNMNTIFDMFYDDNYGRQWKLVIENHLHLGYLYSLKSDFDNAVLSFEHAFATAQKFDALGDVTILKSKFLKGREFNKKEFGSSFVAVSGVKEWITQRLDQLPKALTERQDFEIYCNNSVKIN